MRLDFQKLYLFTIQIVFLFRGCTPHPQFGAQTPKLNIKPRWITFQMYNDYKMLRSS